MREATINQANDAIEVADLACDYAPRIGAIAYAIKHVEQREGVKFSALYLSYIHRHVEGA
jgi:hypothetical protein